MCLLAANAQPRLIGLGLDPGLANELRVALGQSCHRAEFLPLDWLADCLPSLQAQRPDAVLCPARAETLKAVVQGLTEVAPGVPVIVVDPHPDVNSWLDAIGAGAWDYCALSFGSSQLASVLETAVALAGPPARV
jgi:DNA-binding NtrC family response regulator